VASQARTEQAVIANLHKAFRQYMLQETVDELFSLQCAKSFCFGLGIPIAKVTRSFSNFKIRLLLMATRKNIRRQILQGAQSGSHRPQCTTHSCFHTFAGCGHNTVSRKPDALDRGRSWRELSRQEEVLGELAARFLVGSPDHQQARDSGYGDDRPQVAYPV